MQLSEDVQKLLARQVSAEMFAAHLYAAIASWADGQALPGLRAWAMQQARDEESHAGRFRDYLNDRLPAGQAADIPAIAAPPSGFADYAAALQTALNAEQAVSAMLLELHAAGDPATQLLASTQLLSEQVPSERQIDGYLARVRRGASIDLLDGVLFEEASA
jgi:ferritin